MLKSKTMKTKSKSRRKILAVLLSAVMCLSVGAIGVSAAETETATTATTADESTESESSEAEDGSVSYDWSTNTTGNAELTADQEVLMDSGTYQFIAVTTRDDDVFYIIIDKTKTEDNVYFLNDVDTEDIERLVSDDSNSSSSSSSSSNSSSSSEDDEQEATTATTVSSTASSSSSSSSNTMLYAVIGIIVLAGLGFVFFKFKGGKGKGKKSQSGEEDNFIDDEFTEEQSTDDDFGQYDDENGEVGNTEELSDK